MTKLQFKTFYQDILYVWRRWNYFWWLFHKWGQIEELQDLFHWAKRKNLGVQYYYKRIFKEELCELKIHAYHNRETLLWSRRLYRMWCLVT